MHFKVSFAEYRPFCSGINQYVDMKKERRHTCHANLWKTFCDASQYQRQVELYP